MTFRTILFLLALAMPSTGSAVSVDWSCKTLQVLHVSPDGKFAPTGVDNIILNSSFVVDAGSGRMYGKGAPVLENPGAERVILASSTHHMTDYFVTWLFEGRVRTFVIASGQARPQGRLPFTFVDSATNTIFGGTCVLGPD